MATSIRSKQKAGTGESPYRSPTVEDCSDDGGGAGDRAATADGPSLEQRDEGQDATSATEGEANRAVRILLYIARVRIANDNEQWLPPDATPTMHAATAFVAASFFGVNKVEPIQVKVNANLEQKKRSWMTTRQAWLKTLEDLDKGGLATQELSDERMEEGFRLAKGLLARVPKWKKDPPLPQPDPAINAPAGEESETPAAELQTQAVDESTAPAPAGDTPVVASSTIPDDPATAAPRPETVDDLPAPSDASGGDHTPQSERNTPTAQSEPPQTPHRHTKSRASTSAVSAVSTGSSGRRRFAGNVGDDLPVGTFPESPVSSASDSTRPPRETDPGPQELSRLALAERHPMVPQPQFASIKSSRTPERSEEIPERLTDPFLPANFPQTQDEVIKRAATSSPARSKPKTNCQKSDEKRASNPKSDGKRTSNQKSDEQKCHKPRRSDQTDGSQKGNKQRANQQKGGSSSWHGPLPLSRAPAPAATTQTSEGETSRKAGKRKSDEELRRELLQEQALKRRGRDWEAIASRLAKKP